MTTIEGSCVLVGGTPVPAGAWLVVTLEDTSRTDAPARTLAAWRARVDGPAPYRFELGYDPADVDPRARLMVRARVEVDGRLFATTTQANPADQAHPDAPLGLVVLPARAG